MVGDDLSQPPIVPLPKPNARSRAHTVMFLVLSFSGKLVLKGGGVSWSKILQCTKQVISRQTEYTFVRNAQQMPKP